MAGRNWLGWKAPQVLCSLSLHTDVTVKKLDVCSVPSVSTAIELLVFPHNGDRRLARRSEARHTAGAAAAVGGGERAPSRWPATCRDQRVGTAPAGRKTIPPAWCSMFAVLEGRAFKNYRCRYHPTSWCDAREHRINQVKSHKPDPLGNRLLVEPAPLWLGTLVTRPHAVRGSRPHRPVHASYPGLAGGTRSLRNPLAGVGPPRG